MKHFLICPLILVLLLSGCMTEPIETTVESTTAATTQEPIQSEVNLYIPDSPIELASGGALRVYGLDGKFGMPLGFVGDRLLVAASQQENIWELTLLSGDNGTVVNSTVMQGLDINGEGAYLSEAKVCVFEQGTEESSYVFMDANLKEIGRVKMPDNFEASSVLSADMSTVYYVSDTRIYAMDTATGVSRLLTEKSGRLITLRGVILSDTVLVCLVTGEDGSLHTDFISTETGQVLGMDSDLQSICSWGNTYLLERAEAGIREIAIGAVGGDLNSFQPAVDMQYTGTMYTFLENNLVVTVQSTDTGISMDVYDLVSGERTATLNLADYHVVNGCTPDISGAYVWFTAGNLQTEEELLFRWDLEATVVEDSQIYIGTRYTRDNPNTDGIAQCEARAKELEDVYGIDIRFDMTGVEPTDYSFTYEYRVKGFEKALRELEAGLSRFPEGFFKKVAQVSDSRKIHIGLVQSVHGETYNTPVDMAGIQYWKDGRAYIVLEVGESVEDNFYHELCHAMDTYVFAHGTAYDSWEDLNPDGFQYDNNYTDYVVHDHYAYLTGEDCAFIDMYSTSYEIEDRARVFEYAMGENNEGVFESVTMQAKLEKLCWGIRQAFKWKKYEGTFPWEQYLKTSLAYVKDKK